MDNRSGTSVLRTGLITGLFLLMYSISAYAADSFNCSGELYKDQTFSQQVENFTVSDKIYFSVTCTNLPAGSYSIVTHWINPMGRITRQDNHDFELTKTTGYMSYSWMKLLKKGPLQRNFTGQDIDIENYGEWSVKAYLQGQKVAEKKFILH